jgi:hypothetical protein
MPAGYSRVLYAGQLFFIYVLCNEFNWRIKLINEWGLYVENGRLFLWAN